MKIKWNNREELIKYSLDSKRTITRFLLFPLTIKGETRWLETASYQERKWLCDSILFPKKQHFIWIVDKWID